jgi:5'(3')-deoxyribonucleotidase
VTSAERSRSTKPVLAIDLDEVLAPFFEPFLAFYNKTYGTLHAIDHHKTPHIVDLTGDDAEQIKAKFAEYSQTEMFVGVRPLPGAIDAITKLKHVYDLHIITARPDARRHKTEMWLRSHFKEAFRGVHMGSRDAYNPELMTKAERCKALGAKYLVDDDITNATDCAQAGIEVFLFGDYPWNQSKDLPDGVTRAKDWNEVLKVLL